MDRKKNKSMGSFELQVENLEAGKQHSELVFDDEEKALTSSFKKDSLSISDGNES